jgi:hypothetical protein
VILFDETAFAVTLVGTFLLPPPPLLLPLLLLPLLLPPPPLLLLDVPLPFSSHSAEQERANAIASEILAANANFETVLLIKNSFPVLVYPAKPWEHKAWLVCTVVVRF